MLTTHGESRAFQMRILDTDLQAYLQRWPFATGPDSSKNHAGREAISRALEPRPTCTQPEIVMLTPKQTVLSRRERERLHDHFLSLKFERRRQTSLSNDFAWEVNQVPRSAKRILVIGCGDGMELVFLRSILPEASITAIDYHDSLAPAVKETVGVTFLEGDIHLHLHRLNPLSFDLIFSNHTVEHLYTPDETLRNLYRLVAPGGSLISTLPMDANPGSPFLEKVAHISTAKDFHLLDTVFLDAGHPWKTNPSDLNRTLRAIGFTRVKIYQRAKHLSRFVAGGRLRLEIGKNFGLALYALSFGTTRALAKALFPQKASPKLNKILLALERRVWFGTNNLKNRYTEEALIHATKDF